MATIDTGFQHIVLQRHGQVAVITLQRPDRLNAINRQMAQELHDVFDQLSGEFPETRVLIITGEGQIDATTLNGKTLSGVTRAANKQGTPIVALAGTLGKGWEEVHKMGINAVIPICDSPMTLDQAMTHGEKLIEQAAERTLRLMNIK